MQASAQDHRQAPEAASRWPVAPWRVAVLLVCAALALLAGRSAWVDERSDRAASSDPELMSLVAAQWAAAEATARPGTGSPAPWLQSLRRDVDRVGVLLSGQRDLEPRTAAAVDSAHQVWQRAQRDWLQSLGAGVDGEALAAQARAAALSSQALLQALRERAEQRRPPEAARPGVLLAVASLGLLLIGWGLPKSAGAGREATASRLPADAAEASAPLAEPGTVAVGVLQQRLAEGFAQSPQGGAPGSLLALQMAWPSDCGDERCAGSFGEVRRELVRRLRLVLRSDDLIALSTPPTGEAALIAYLWAAAPEAETAPRLLAEAADAYTLHDHPHRLRVRMGLCELDQAGDAATAWNELHVALAQAWRSEQMLVAFTPALGDWQQRASAFGESLQQAIAQGEVQVRHEPVLEMASGRVIGLRSSVGWLHPTRGALAADQFIAQAEDAGCAQAVSEIVWRDALSLLAELRTRLGPSAPRWIQLPGWPHVWQDPKLPEQVQALLAEQGLPPDAVQILVAEPLLAAEAEIAHRIASLRSLGVGVAIEGLGRASASLSWLSRLPVSTVMIDPQFVAGVPGNETHELLIAAIVSLAAEPGSTPCADGVADDRTAAALQALGVPCALGPQFAAPMPRAELLAWLPRRSG